MHVVTDKLLRQRLTQRRNSWRDQDTIPAPSLDDLTYARALISDPCAFCGQHGGCIDHMTHTQHGWPNLTSSCKGCNIAKGQLSLLRFMLAAQLRKDRARGRDKEPITQQIRALGDPHGTERHEYPRLLRARRAAAT